MKRIALIYLAIILMIIPIMTVNCSSESEYQIDFPSIRGLKGNPTFEVDTTLPNIDEMMIYKVKQSHISADMANKVAKNLGFDSNGFQNYGVISYDNSEILFPEETQNMPSKEEAKLIATEFLAECGLLPSDVIVEEPVVGCEFSGPDEELLEETGEVVSVTYIQHWLIRFTINIDGFPVVGPGNKFAVRVGNNGEIVGLLIVWRDVESYKSIGIKSAQQALQELKDGKGEHNAMADCKKVLIKRVYLAYWMEDASTAQENVVPVYTFEGDCLGDNGEYLEDFRGWCNAV